MNIIDAHHHLWCPETDNNDIAYVWLKNIGAIKPFGDPTPIQRDYLISEYLAESTTHTVLGSVHVQADGAIPDPVAETRWVQSISAESALPSAIIGFVDLTSGNVESTIAAHRQFPGFRGVRQILSKIDSRPEISFVKEHYLDNTLWQEQFALLERNSLSFDAQLYPEQMLMAAEFFARHCNTPIIIDHAGSPFDQSAAGLRTWEKGLAVMADLPHCTIKLSGFGMFDRDWSTNSIQTMFDFIIDAFGPTRVMFGSNFPVDKLMLSFDEVVNNILRACELKGLSADEISCIFEKTCRNIYRLEV